MIEDRPTGVISAVEPDPRRAGAVRVLVAGAPYCTIAAGVARAEGLVPGRPIDEALHEPGIVWGALKARAHLRRHRP